METKNTDLSSLKINRTEKQEYSSSNKKVIKVVAIIIMAAVVIIAGYLIVSPIMNPSIEVKLVEASLQSPSLSSTELIASGYVVAQRKAAVASKGTGRLVYLGVVEGDKVKKGEVIARLENSDIKAQLEAAEANLELSKSGLKNVEDTYKREKALFKSGLASQADLDASEANYKQVLASIDLAKANVNAAKVAMEYTIIRAPFDGTVLTKDADVGEIVAPFGASVNSKGAVVTIADMSSLQVEADVSESNIEKISPNQSCEIVLDAYPDYNYPAYVSKIVPTADRTKATVMVKVAFKKYDSRVLPEMSAKVMFLTKSGKQNVTNQKPVLTVPNTAVANRDGNQVVFMVKNGKAIQLPVSVGRKLGDYLEIRSGIVNGDQVIANVTEKIKNGMKVEVK